MELKYNTGAFEFIGYFAKRPSRIADYFKISALSGKSPFDLELPWIALDAIDNIEKNITSGMKVFEYGAGGSTVYFSKKGCIVTSAENDLDWVKQLQKYLEQKKLTQTTLRHGDFDRNKPGEAFQHSDFYLSLKENEKYDLILIDGLEIPNYEARPLCFYKAEKHINPGGIIVVDDSWRYDHLHKNNSAKSFKRFTSIGPGRKGLTSTDLFFY